MTTTSSPPPTETDGVRTGTATRRTRILRRPEIGAAAAAFVIFLFFTLYTDQFVSELGVSTWMNSASRFGIMAVAVALLMIGGEFDLSTGVMVGSTGLLVGVLTTEYGLNVWVAVLLALVMALAVGAINGIVVMRTGLPSFIVTLGTFFILQGLNLALVKAAIGTVSIQGLQDIPYYDSIRPVFGRSVDLGFTSVAISVFWWFGVIAVATWVLLRTRIGNWIFAVGGADTAARQVGVPLVATKVGLFMATAAAGWLVGMINLFQFEGATSATGVGDEFIFIICAVVGGCLLTGGYGSAIGAALGALIYGMTNQGIVYAGWDADWLRTFLGVMLLAAALVNIWVRKQAGVTR